MPELFRFPDLGDYRALARATPFYADGLPDSVTKADVREHADALIHPTARETDLTQSSTSGSTGTPFRFYESDFDRQVFKECYNRAYLFFPRDSYKAVTISDFAESDKEDAPLYSLAYSHPGFSKATHHLFRFLSSRDPCDVLAERLTREAPGLLEGYPSAIYLAARVLIRERRPLTSVEVISPCGEFLRPEDRPAMRAAFPNAQICARYGANELGPMAWECPFCARYHFNSDHYAFRVIDGGRLAISKRYVSGCQLAHYDIGDQIRPLSVGDCRVQLPTIEVLEGRRDDLLIGPEGQPLPVMPYHFGDIPELIQWQIVQEEDLSLILNAIVEEPSEALRDTLLTRLRRDLGTDALPVELRFVSKLAGPSKLKRIVSKVALED